MEVIVPFSTDRPKSRLSGVLSRDERNRFAREMLDDVLDAVVAAGGEPQVLATDAVDADLPCPVTVDDRPLTDAVNAALDARLGESEPVADRVAVVMADLALATPEALRELFAAGREADVAIAPGRGGGTNAFVAGHPEFETDYHGASYLDHRRIADEVGASVEVVDSHRLATDIDEPTDLAELLIHAEADGDGNDGGGGGKAPRWLRDAGFALDTTDGRVGIERE
ncbi:2-phospho-L-lactate guanylyltransferase [Halorubrum halophilum]|uniref:2-phospho-L-lactate guanylyltransferase n=1 Tax=Halorubrum halophilum TaxID=413816 RepID=UPI00067924BC|nr:2-phospho-L-lactate guanylyltransferase [Halorubrum halophilum]